MLPIVHESAPNCGFPNYYIAGMLGNRDVTASLSFNRTRNSFFAIGQHWEDRMPIYSFRPPGSNEAILLIAEVHESKLIFDAGGPIACGVQISKSR